MRGKKEASKEKFTNIDEVNKKIQKKTKKMTSNSYA